MFVDFFLLNFSCTGVQLHDELVYCLLRFIYLAWTEHFLNGYLSENSLLWSEGRSDWQPVLSIPELMTAISQPGVDSSSAGEDFCS